MSHWGQQLDENKHMYSMDTSWLARPDGPKTIKQLQTQTAPVCVFVTRRILCLSFSVLHYPAMTELHHARKCHFKLIKVISVLVAEHPSNFYPTMRCQSKVSSVLVAISCHHYEDMKYPCLFVVYLSPSNFTASHARQKQWIILINLIW